LVRKVGNPGGHKGLTIAIKIIVVTTEEEKVGEMATNLISGKGFFIAHEVANTGSGVLKIVF